MSAGAVCDGCRGPVSHAVRHFVLEDRPPDSLIGFHNVTRYDLCTAMCIGRLARRLAHEDFERGLGVRPDDDTTNMPLPGVALESVSEPWWRRWSWTRWPWTVERKEPA